jgi:hypothetical protein
MMPNQPHFCYAEAFGRNLGIVSPDEQARLRHSRVAVAGLGGVGGVYAQALARLGVGRFSLADGDVFEVANFNRQMGGTLSSAGQNKARALERQIHDVNPEAGVSVWEEYLNEQNIGAFLENADLVIDAIEMFAVPAHRLLLREARKRGLTVLFAAPLGFSAAVLVFSPDGMTADEYFDWRDGQSDFERFAQFVLGIAPGLLHLKDLDLRYVDVERRTGPSHIAACMLCAGIVLTEATRLLLDRPGRWCAPRYLQFDPYRARVQFGRLWGGNRNPLQRLKKFLLLRRYRRTQREREGRKASSAMVSAHMPL